MMGSMTARRPIQPPPGVDPAEWDARVDAEARARIALEEQVQYVLWERKHQAKLEERRRKRLMWLAILGISLLIVAIDRWPALTFAVIATVVWWRAGKPGLQQARSKLVQLKQ